MLQPSHLCAICKDEYAEEDMTYNIDYNWICGDCAEQEAEDEEGNVSY